MNKSREEWSPDVEARLAALRNAIKNSDDDAFELEIAGTPIPCHLGSDREGSIWMRIHCDPSTVSVDDRSAAVVFKLAKSGYTVHVSPNAPDIVACHLFDEMIQLLEEGAPPGEVGHQALQHWRDLLAQPAGSIMSENALAGLFGELEVLEAIVERGGEVDYWTGWNRDHQDFRLPGLTVEVKATTSANYRRVQIHGLGQLDDPEDGSTLILVLKRLERSQSGRSLPDIIESIVKAGVSRAILLDRLSRVGYSDQHRDHYSHSKFISVEVALRRVDDSHPRLIPELLSKIDLSSIDKINYELNLNGDADADLDQTLGDVISEFLEES